MVYRLHIDIQSLRLGNFIADVKTVSDGFYSFDSPKTFEHIDQHGHENNRHEGARYFVGDTGSVGNDENTEYSYAQRPEIGGLDVLEVSDPLGYEIGGDAVHR